jgi:hypothetical protein
MAKNSLIISDDEKYGRSPSSMLAEPSPAAAAPAGAKNKKPKSPKHAPTLDLTASQVDSFGLDGATVGQTGCAMIHYTVKSCSAGESYGTEVPVASSNKKVCISITHVDPDCEAPADEEGGEGGKGGEDEEDEGIGGADEADSSDEAAEEDDTKPKAPTKETLSPSAALGEEDE